MGIDPNLLVEDTEMIVEVAVTDASVIIVMMVAVPTALIVRLDPLPVVDLMTLVLALVLVLLQHVLVLVLALVIVIVIVLFLVIAMIEVTLLLWCLEEPNAMFALMLMVVMTDVTIKGHAEVEAVIVAHDATSLVGLTLERLLCLRILT